MQRESPLVSVVIPTYNCAKWLPQAINSVLDQIHRPLELIVVDDGSTDETANVVESFAGDVRYKHQENQGPAAARNTGLELAQGSVLAFLDADDLWTTDKLAVQVPRLRDDPTLDIVLGQTQILVLDGAASGFRPYRYPWHATSFGAGLFRRRVFDQVGRLDPALRSSEDVQWFLRARDCEIAIEFMSSVSQFYRWHHTNQCRTTGFASDDFFQLLRRRIKRTPPSAKTRGPRWGSPLADTNSPPNGPRETAAS